MTAVSKISVGQALDERFLLIEEIGRGGMSVIYKAKDLKNQDELVAVKVPHAIFSSGVGSWSMFQQEEAIGRKLNHPYVLKFMPLAVDKRRPYMVTELVPGQTLTERLRSQCPLPESEALAIASQICEAIRHVHERGYVHYDLKPDNVILCPDGTIRLIDFGLSHAVDSSRFSLSGAPPEIGTADYVAPEQIRRKRGRKSADVYAIGAMLYEMLTGQPPFPGDDPFKVGSTRLLGDPLAPRAVNPSVTRAVEDIVLRALRRKPVERYPSVAALKSDLDNPAGVSILNFRERLQPITRWRRNLRIIRHYSTIILLPVVSQIVLFLLLWHHFARGH